MMEVLYKEKIQSLIVEGGSTLLQSFIDTHLWDEACMEESPIFLTNGIKAPRMPQKYLSTAQKHFGRILKYVVNNKVNI